MDAYTLDDIRRAAYEAVADDEGRLLQFGDEALAVLAGEFPRNSRSSAYESLRLVKAGAVTVYGFSGYSSRVSAQFVQLYDAASADLLASGAVPEIVVSVPAGANFSYDAGVHGRRFLRGCVIANSSTGPTYTAGSADTWFDVQFV